MLAAPFPAAIRRVGPIRVLLGEMPEMLHDILDHAVADQDDVALVGDRDSISSLHTAVDVHSADVVVVGVERQDWVGSYIDLFRDHPMLRLLAIRNDGRAAVMHELSIRRYRVTDLTPSSIIDAIRASVADAHDEADALFFRDRP
jgi:hypothetical protein